MQKSTDPIEEGQQAYQEWRDNLLANPEFRAIYEEEAAKKEIWLKLVEARQKQTSHGWNLLGVLVFPRRKLRVWRNMVMMHIASTVYVDMCKH